MEEPRTQEPLRTHVLSRYCEYPGPYEDAEARNLQSGPKIQGTMRTKKLSRIQNPGPYGEDQRSRILLRGLGSPGNLKNYLCILFCDLEHIFE